jgi:nucleoside-diphosphate-sugar epimerase
MTIKSVAITGASGYVGRFVTAELQSRGIAVRALARLNSNRDGFAAPVEWITGDLRSEDALAQLVNGVDAVVHLAYEHAPGKYRGGEGADLGAWLESNVNGSLRLLMTAQQANVEKFIFLSSRAVFSRTEPGRVLDEDHPTSPDTHYGAYKVAVEAFLKSFAQVGGMKTISVRATGVYGLTYPLERSKWWNLIQAVVNDQPITSSGGGTEVHGADVARVITALLEQPTLDFDSIHLSDLYVTHHEVVRLARQLADKPGSLPPAPVSSPTNMLVSCHLAGLGITLGGQPLLEATIADLIQAARA